jgi:hypothetical protein
MQQYVEDSLLIAIFLEKFSSTQHILCSPGAVGLQKKVLISIEKHTIKSKQKIKTDTNNKEIKSNKFMRLFYNSSNLSYDLIRGHMILRALNPPKPQTSITSLYFHYLFSICVVL